MTTKSTKPKEQLGRPVLVTTAHRGVFFGYEESRDDASTIILRRARNCILWRGIKGFLALAETGPSSECRIGPAAERLELLGVTSIADVTPAAVDKWESAPWR